jgi:hypothetical protein
MSLAVIPERTRDRHAPMITAIHNDLRASPELRLIAALIAQALTDARGGCPEALDWLRSLDALRWIERLTPVELNGETVQLALLEAAGQGDAPQRAAPGRIRQLLAKEGVPFAAD